MTSFRKELEKHVGGGLIRIWFRGSKLWSLVKIREFGEDCLVFDIYNGGSNGKPLKLVGEGVCLVSELESFNYRDADQPAEKEGKLVSIPQAKE